MTEIDDPEVLRKEIRTMLAKVTDRGSLIFFQWLVRRVLANYPIPGDEELRALHQAFIRMHTTFRAKKRPTKEDMELVAKSEPFSPSSEAECLICHPSLII